MKYTLIDIPRIKNPKGNLAVVELDTIPFPIQRVYYLYDVPAGSKRGGHAHKNLQQLLVPVSGSFDVVLKDGKHVERITLNRPDKGLLIENNIWRELENFTSGAVCMVLASAPYDEADYIRVYRDYLNYLKEL
jgi:dTDP-4-dehydrorhamnose 3,5-epimerase-like enzyme